MSITFRIASAADDRAGATATINTRQLVAFHALLLEESARSQMMLIDPIRAEDVLLSRHFEARVSPLALAAVARVFDFACDVISVVEEAQYRNRRVCIGRSHPVDEITMRVAATSDAGLELALATNSAFALLESLGLRPDSVGEIPIEAIRARLANPAVRRRAACDGVTHHVDQLDRLLASAVADDACRLEWA